MIPQRKYCNHYGYLVWIDLILQGSCKRKTYTCTFLWFLLPSLKFHSFVKWEIESFKTTYFICTGVYHLLYCWELICHFNPSLPNVDKDVLLGIV